ncbi:DUF3422 family protein [Salaquimonas pukyongi]|uniref:DUF3422 family protein n=1 Tax=Salaquimonas pukyongi TaxID=2712698 RepID=UPI0009F901EE|nr:DUF3422 family protein [Salaquimonas pukyongi]
MSKPASSRAGSRKAAARRHADGTSELANHTSAATARLNEFPRHPEHAFVVGEIHSRPLPEFETNRVVLHFAFMSEGGKSVASAVFAHLCRMRGETVPAAEMRYHAIPWGRGRLQWESHSEFTAFTFDAPAPRSFLGDLHDHPFAAGFNPPGSLISATRLEIRANTPANRKLLAKFDPESLAVNRLSDGKSLLATDFRQDPNGMTVFLLLESGLGSAQVGAYTKMAIELETYRTLAMLGLPLARSLSQKLSHMEVDLSRLTAETKDASADESAELLAKINSLAAELESDAAASLFRFGASRAYGGIVQDRIKELGSESLSGNVTLGSYLNRSLPPALRTCASVEDRQANLSRKLARVANLLRAKVDIEIESQNRNLLSSMNKRTRMQLRLQQTVEGLSVAAVSYYVVGLFYYLSQALEKYLPAPLTPKMLAGMFVPVAVFCVWVLVRRIRGRHGKSD